MADPAAPSVAASVVLASASPRRASLLSSLGVTFDVVPVDIDEVLAAGNDDPAPAVAVGRIARAKLDACDPAMTAGRPVLVADTMVVLDDRLLGKPLTEDELDEMLSSMSGRTITVTSVVGFGTSSEQASFETVSTDVGLRKLSADDISAYVATGTGFDKAGGLALQAEAGPFVDQVDGCWSNVVGLPLCAVSSLLALGASELSGQDRCSVGLCGSR